MIWPPNIPENPVLLGVLIVFWIAVLIQWLYFFIVFSRASQSMDTGEETVPVSVILCVKNEEKNLRELIPLIMDQDHPEFELVVINDNSWDESEDILDAYQKSYPNLKVTNLSEDKQWMQGKKFALTLGIKAARYDHVLLTDADCRPQSRNWIKLMSSALTRKEVVLSYSPYQFKKNSLLNSLIRFDAFHSALNYLGFASLGVPYMGVGRNLAYKKDLFFNVGGFRSHMNLMSGDDDLFINQVAGKRNTGILVSEGSHMESRPAQSLSAWIKQKRRHLTTAPFYKFKHKLLLSLFPLTFYLMWILGVLLMVFHTHPLLVIVPLLLRYLFQIIIFSRTSRQLHNNDLSWKAWLLEAIWMIIMPVLSLMNMVRKPNAWQ